MDMAQRTVPDVKTLGETGDLSAPPGSRPWAIAVRLEIEACLHNTQTSAARLAWLIQTMEEHAGYKQLTDERGQVFATYRAFCEAKPPWGLGYSPDVIDRIINERKTAQQRAEQPATLFDAHRPTDEERNNFDYVKDNPGGNSADYLTARIARDRPDILEDMRAGKYKSVRAAALDAGIVRARISIPADAEDAAIVLLKKFSADELQRIVEIIANHIAVDA